MGIIDPQSSSYCHLLSGFSSKFQSFMTMFHRKNVEMQNMPKVDELK